MANKAEIQQQLEDRMREFQTQIDQLNHKIEQSGKETRHELERTLEDIQARNEKAEQQLKEVRAASDDVIQTLANDIETYWGAFTGAVDNVFIKKTDKAPSNNPNKHPNGKQHS